jgi:hypothetical protein
MATIPKRMLSTVMPAESATKLSDSERRAALKGKRILVTGAGHLEKSFIIDRMIELGCKVVVVDVPGSYAATEMPGIEKFIEVRYRPNRVILSHSTLEWLWKHVFLTFRFLSDAFSCRFYRPTC